MDEIAISHRVGKPPDATDGTSDTDPAPPKTSVGEVLHPKIEEPSAGYQEVPEAPIARGQWWGGVR